MTESTIWDVPVRLAPSAPRLGEHVAQEIRLAIIGGSLARDTHLVESRLSDMFGVSRGPVRDALQRLTEEGLVESRRRGTYVRGLDEEDIDELYSLRQLIESDVIRRCLESTTVDLTPVRDALANMSTAIHTGDASTFARADLDFHSAFYDVAGHRRIRAIWQQYRPTFAGMLEVTNAIDENLTPTLEDHEVLLDAVIVGDRERALSLLEEHLDGSRRRMLTAYGRERPPRQP
jgi:GntR family transcriptional regulator of gluconate operon